jgi:hypothetical protein
MLIFYVKKPAAASTSTITSSPITPIVIIDAMSSDDRFTEKEILLAINTYAPNLNTSSPNAVSTAINKPQVFSCEYTAQFEHAGIPLGASIKTRFSGTLKSPPAALVDAFSPKFLTSSQSVEQLANSLSAIPNAQTNVCYAAMVFKGMSGKNISRQFIVYAAPMFPDAYGTTTTMVLSGALIDDVMIKTATFCQIDKKSILKNQLEAVLSAQSPALVGNYDNCPQASEIPATEILLKPMKLFDLLSEVCLQNKMLFTIDYPKAKVMFYGQDQASAPKDLKNEEPSKFSFLGSEGSIAWGLGVENYTNIKFKTSIFDSKIFNKVIIYNDINSAFFGGLTKTSKYSSTLKSNLDAYEAWIIRYAMRWNRNESVCEVTASNNWLMAQFRVDALLETAIYSSAAANL